MFVLAHWSDSKGLGSRVGLTPCPQRTKKERHVCTDVLHRGTNYLPTAVPWSSSKLSWQLVILCTSHCQRLIMTYSRPV